MQDHRFREDLLRICPQITQISQISGRCLSVPVGGSFSGFRVLGGESAIFRPWPILLLSSLVAAFRGRAVESAAKVRVPGFNSRCQSVKIGGSNEQKETSKHNPQDNLSNNRADNQGKNSEENSEDNGRDKGQRRENGRRNDRHGYHGYVNLHVSFAFNHRNRHRNRHRNQYRNNHDDRHNNSQNDRLSVSLRDYPRDRPGPERDNLWLERSCGS
jgi:hypothetical protein